MTRIEIIEASNDPLERKVWTFAVDLVLDRLQSTLEQVHEQDRASLRHRAWRTVRRVRFVQTRHDNYMTGRQTSPWSRWADVTAFIDNRYYGRHDSALQAIDPPTIPDHIVRQLEERLRPILSTPANQPKPEQTT